AMFGQRRFRAALEETLVRRFETTCDDADAVSMKEERPGDADRLRSHRVLLRVEGDVARRSDEDREAQRELRGRHAESAKTYALLRDAHARHDAGRARLSHGVDLVMPLRKLRREVFIVDEAALLEEGALHPADEVLDGALLLTAARPADLDADA